jgi:Uma2 family endonuclease
MAIGTLDNEPKAITFLFTAADVAVLPSSLPSGDVKYELDNGRLVVMPPPAHTHGAYQSNLAAELKAQGEKRGHGKCRVESGVLLWEDPDRLVGPDAMFITNEQLPIKESSEGYLLTIPALVVEVLSKNDSASYIAEKVRDYLKAGVKVIWIADSVKRVVAEHRTDGTTKTFKETETLLIEDVVPGFRMPVRVVFRE